MNSNSHTHKCLAALFGCHLALQLVTSAQNAPSITSVSINEAGRIAISFDAANSEYLVESADTLSNTVTWGSVCRLTSPGGTTTVTEPIEAGVESQFYRISAIAASDASVIEGPIAAEFDAQIIADLSGTTFSYLQTVLGLDFDRDAPGVALLPVAGLSSANRDARIYTAAIGSLAKLADTILAGITFSGGTPSDSEIVTALLADLSDGSLNGLNASNPIEIGTSGEDLPSLSEQDFLDSYAALQIDVLSLYNIVFATGSNGGTVGTSTPSDWGTFYWDSADWQ